MIKWEGATVSVEADGTLFTFNLVDIRTSCRRTQDTLGGLRQVRLVSWLRVQSHGHDSHFDFSQLTARFNLHWCDPHLIVCRLQLDMRLVRTVLILDEQMLKGFLGIGQIDQVDAVIG